MKTYPEKNDAGEKHAFEIANNFLSSNGIARFIGRCPGVKITRVRRIYALDDEVHVEFELNGDRYHVWEPFGDNSRLWIGPAQGQQRFQSIDLIQRYVTEHWPGPVSRGLAQLVALFRTGTP
jgi:hypothetical protein